MVKSGQKDKVLDFYRSSAETLAVTCLVPLPGMIPFQLSELFVVNQKCIEMFCFSLTGLNNSSIHQVDVILISNLIVHRCP